MVGPCESIALANAHGASESRSFKELCVVNEQLSAVTMPREFRESSTKAGTKLCELLAKTDDNSRDGHLKSELTAAIEAGEIR